LRRRRVTLALTVATVAAADEPALSFGQTL